MNSIWMPCSIVRTSTETNKTNRPDMEPCRHPNRCTWQCNGHCATCEWCAWKHENRDTSHPDDLL